MKSRNAVPDYFYNKITDITVDDIKKMKVNTLAVDLDNTLVNDSSYRISKKMRDWVHEMKNSGISVVIVSNTFIHRSILMSLKLGGIPFVAHAHKPSALPLKIAAKLAGTDISSVAMIGDRLFTDVLSANRAGAVSVKVEPIKDEVLFASRFRRIRKEEKKYLEAMCKY